MEFVRVGLVAENGGTIVVGEGVPDRLDIIHKIEDENIMLLRVGAVES